MLWTILSILVGILVIGIIINLISRFATLAVGWKLGSVIVSILLIIALIYMIRQVIG